MARPGTDIIAKARQAARECSVDLSEPEVARLAEAVARAALSAIADELRTRFANFDIRRGDPNSFATGWMSAADYSDPDHEED